MTAVAIGDHEDVEQQENEQDSVLPLLPNPEECEVWIWHVDDDAPIVRLITEQDIIDDVLESEGNDDEEEDKSSC